MLLASIIDLGTLPGDTESIAEGINNLGQVVGDSSNDDLADGAFLYSNGVMTNLGTLPGDSDSYAYGINDSGQIVGASTASGGDAFIYSGGVMSSLGTLGGNISWAFAINDAGQVVGRSTTEPGDLDFRAFLYSDGVMSDLGTLGGANSEALAINDAGQIGGAAQIADRESSVPFLYDDGRMETVGSPAPTHSGMSSATGFSLLSGEYSGVNALNNEGVAAGSVGRSAAIFMPAGVIDLGTFGGVYASATGINASGQVVGNIGTADGGAFLYSDGQTINLNSLLPANSGWTLTEANAINDEGQIVGEGTFNGQDVAYLLTLGESTATTVQSSAPTSVYGQPVTFTAAVTTASGGTPTGTVQFYVDGVPYGDAVTLVGGSASIVDPGLPLGAHELKATYTPADDSFSASVSAPADQEVQASGATTTTLVSSVSPSDYGQSVTFTASVTVVAPGAATPTGDVTFLDGSTSLGTVTLDETGTASFSTSALAVGRNSVTAVYGGDTNDQGSTSSAVSELVNQANTTTALSSSVDPSVLGHLITFTAAVTLTSGSGRPTGTVTFYDGTTDLGTAALSGDTAEISTALLVVGSHSITVVYSGNTDFFGSTSSVLTQTVNQTTTTPTPTPTQMSIIGEQPLLEPKRNKKRNPAGKAVLSGFTLDFGVALNSVAAENAANYQVVTVTTKKVKKKNKTILHPLTNLTISYIASSDAVEITFGANETFPAGGQITVLGGLTTASGGTLSGPAVFTISKGGKSIDPS